jgi:hypothetical protein
VFVEPCIQLLDVRRAAVAVADRVEQELPAREPEPAQQLCIELYDLRIDRRIGAPDRLDRELPELAIAAALRSGVPVHGVDRVELHRLGGAVHPVLDVGAADRRRRLGPEREAASALVLEGVHLLLHDVGALARRPLEELGVLEDGRPDPAVAVGGRNGVDLVGDLAPERRIGREDVVRAARPLDAHEARSSARNGLRSSSAPRVVTGP